MQAGHHSYHRALWEKKRDQRSKINLRIYWYGCVLRYSALDCVHEHSNAGRQIVTLRAENYYAANNYSEQRSRRKVQSVIRSLPHSVMIRSQHCKELKAVICDCDYECSCQKCLRHEIFKFFFIIYVYRAKWYIFFMRNQRISILPPAFSGKL